MRKGGFILALFLLVSYAAATDSFESDDTANVSNSIPANASRQNHTFHAPGDVDYINFTASAGFQYLIETFNLTNLSSTDTVITLYEQDGATRIMENDDILSGRITTSRLVWNASANGTYFVKITEYDNSSGGNYLVMVAKLGRLEPVLVTGSLNVTKNTVFNFTATLRCAQGVCLNVTATLDPEQKTKTELEVKSVLNLKEKVDIIVKLNDKSELKGLRKKGIKREFTSFSGAALAVTDEELKELEKNPKVEKIFYDREVHTFLSTSVPYINATKVWPIQLNNTNITGLGETICVIDTGINYSHSAFGSCARTSDINDGSCLKVIGGYDFVNGDRDPYDDNGHGTHVSGIAASNDSVYRGVAPDARIVMIKALNSGGSGSTSDIISAIEWCVNNRTRFNITVISMSFGDDSSSSRYSS
ncbi:DVUA0089 family protein, partial [Candidatus Woesearchaeota archaeon]|nr:DVUA0089 family protein [Candidatus Woesearchaeota archaeon]